MSIQVRPATEARFDDVTIMLGPKNPDSSVCWCLSHRVDSKTNRELVGPARGAYVRELCRRDVAPGVLAYVDDEVAGWAAVAPRAELPFARSRKIPHVDSLAVWSVWCIRVRPGHRGEGLSHPLLEGAVAYARSQGAPAVEGYPVDNQGAKVDTTMAYVGTRALFERSGFTKAADTDAVSGGFPRVLMRLALALTAARTANAHPRPLEVHMPHGSHGHGGGAIEGRHSHRYDRLARLLMKPVYRRIAADIAESAPQKAAVLDIGTGPGLLLKMLGLARTDLRLTGVDIAADMIDHARRNLADLDEHLELRTADVAALPFENDRFDLIVSSFSSHHWEEPEAAAAEIARVLRPGGRLLDYDFKHAPFETLTNHPGLSHFRQARFRTGWSLIMRTTRFEATAS